MEAIEIKLDEQNELFFNVQVEGSSPGAVTVRLVCESEDFSAVFPGSYTDEGEVRVVIPELKKNASFKEGKERSLSAGRPFCSKERQFVAKAFPIFRIDQEILEPKARTLADGSWLRALEVGIAEARGVRFL